MIHRLKNVVLLAASLFFLAFGIQVLMLAYRLNDPFSFVMTFFASNLMILISAVLALGFFLKLIRPKGNDSNENQDERTVVKDDSNQ